MLMDTLVLQLRMRTYMWQAASVAHRWLCYARKCSLFSVDFNLYKNGVSCLYVFSMEHL